MAIKKGQPCEGGGGHFYFVVKDGKYRPLACGEDSAIPYSEGIFDRFTDRALPYAFWVSSSFHSLVEWIDEHTVGEWSFGMSNAASGWRVHFERAVDATYFQFAHSHAFLLKSPTCKTISATE